LISLGESEGLSQNPRALLNLVAALSLSIYFSFQRPHPKKYGALAFTTYTISVGAILTIVFLPGLVSLVQTTKVGTALAMVNLGVFSIATAYVTYAYVFSRIVASRAVSFLCLTSR
jgi:drug/metabolite transporter (DMT)-like permease